MVVVVSILLGTAFVLVLATGGAALPIALLIPIAGLLIYLVWSIIQRAFTRQE